MSWSGRSVLLCTNCGVASSLLIPPGDFISPDLPIEDTGPLRPSGGEFDPSRLKANRDKITEATNDTIHIAGGPLAVGRYPEHVHGSRPWFGYSPVVEFSEHL